MILNINGTPIPCYLDWFLSLPGIISSFASIILAFIGAMVTE